MTKTLKDLEYEEIRGFGNEPHTFVNKKTLKQEAIKHIKEIQSGSGVDRTKFPEDMKGEVPKACWNDGIFTLGIEYGFIIGLMEFLDITKEDLEISSQHNSTGDGLGGKPLPDSSNPSSKTTEVAESGHLGAGIHNYGLVNRTNATERAVKGANHTSPEDEK